MFVHVDEAVALGMSLIDGSNSMDKAVARQWAYEAVRDIGPTDSWFKQCTLYPNENRSFKKPIDMWKPIDIALYDSAGCELRFSYKGLGKRIHRGNTLITQGTYAPALHAAIDLSEDKNYFHLGSNGATVVAAFINYWQLPVDEDGLPIIPEGQKLAVAFFISWLWAKRQRENQTDIATSRADYMAQRAKCRNEANLPNGINMDQIGKDFTSMINAYNPKQF